MLHHPIVTDKYIINRELECLNEFMSYGQILDGQSEWSTVVSHGIDVFMEKYEDSGIPYKYRKFFWAKLLKFEDDIDYQMFVHYENKFSKAIKLDVPRTFVNLPFISSNSKQKLYRILNVFSGSHEEVGYYQGMNYIAAIILLVFNLDEKKSYESFSGIMLNFNLLNLYKDNFALLLKYISKFKYMLEVLCPNLTKHFDNKGIDFSMYLQQWFLTLFVVNFPIRTVLIFWDYILANGIESVLNISLSILSIFEPQLLQLDMEGIFSFFRSFKEINTFDDYKMACFIVKNANEMFKKIEVLKLQV